ncbi:MAG TPA: bacillithiol biosynthesis deacetylase BshB1 [Candidatus Acidoferrales bacterium]|nr:bacillithiol biosynthesis deacetylase BshB1 [Candidatus Acidoferrales bacterium]
MKLYALAFGAHPDDVEMSCGGTLSMLNRNGKPFGIIDLTRGEMGTRGNAAIRANEAKEAAKILGADTRINLGIPDSDIELSRKNLLKIIELLRRHQPEIVFAPFKEERHPDHVHTHQLVSEAVFYSGLVKLRTGKLSPHRPRRAFYYMQHRAFRPMIYVDISNDYETKVAAIKAHKSQFFNPSSKDPETALSTPEFLEYLFGRMRYHGRQAGVRYAEPFWTTEPLTVSNFDCLV